MKQKILGRTKLKISRLGLGTAEIGFAYGIGPRTIPSKEEAISLLQFSVDLGVNYFDTAIFYGVAEERIGQSGITKNPKVVIATKCGQFLEQGEDPRGMELVKRIGEQVETSLKNLNVDCVPILMLHGGSAEQIQRGELTGILDKLKQEGKVRFLGIATRGEEAPLTAITSGAFDVIQVSYSILDARMAKRVFVSATENNIGVVNRSVLLKGSLTGLVSFLPKHLELLKINSKIAASIASDLEIDLPTLAFRYILSEQAISTSLVGTNQKQNLLNAYSAIEAGPLSQEIIEKLKKLAIANPTQVDPAKWNCS